jgi:hypothetical protein
MHQLKGVKVFSTQLFVPTTLPLLSPRAIVLIYNAHATFDRLVPAATAENATHWRAKKVALSGYDDDAIIL